MKKLLLLLFFALPLRAAIQITKPAGSSPTVGAAISGASADQIFIGGTGGSLAQVSTFTMTTAGKMGIGTTSPSARLTLFGGDFTMNSSAGSVDRYINFSINDSIQEYIHYRSYSGSGVNAGFDFSGKFKIETGTGFVGLGTVSPSTKFHVSSGVVTVDGTGAGLSVVGTSSATYFVGNGSLLTNLPASGFTMYVGTFTVAPGSRSGLAVTKTTKTGLNSITTGDICSVAFVSYSNSGPPSPSAGDVSGAGALDIWWTNPSASNVDPGNVVLRYFCVRP